MAAVETRSWTAQTLRVLLYAGSLVSDTLAVAVGFLAPGLLAHGGRLTTSELALAGIVLPVFVTFSISKEAQSVETLQDSYLGVQRVVSALFAALVVALMLLFLTRNGEQISRTSVILSFAASLSLLFVSRGALKVAVRHYLPEGAVSTAVLVDGTNDIDIEPGMKVIDVRARGLRPSLDNPETLARLSALVDGFDRIIVTCDDAHRSAWADFLRASEVGGEVVIGPSDLLGGVGIGRCHNHDTLILSRGPLNLASRLQKRLFDLAIALPLLVLLTPLMVAVAIAIKVEDGGQVLFRQKRIGKGNRYFEILKFRSMAHDRADPDGVVSTMHEDPRISRVGRFIRRTSMDELPQLFNVIAGEMSLVGPRPHALGSLAGSQLFWDVNRHYWQRHSLRPGMTGLAQIRGYRGPTESIADLENRLRCDLEYLASWSIFLDIRILLATFPVLVHEKAY